MYIGVRLCELEGVIDLDVEGVAEEEIVMENVVNGVGEGEGDIV